MSLLLLFQAASSSYNRRIPSGASGPALGDVILARHGDRGRQHLTMGGVAVSWEVNAAGAFSAFAPIDELLEISANPEDLRGWWLMWQHPTLASFGGPVTDVAIRSTGIVEIAATGWLALLAKRLTRRRDQAVSAQAGAIAARIVRDAGAVEPTGIAGVSADEWGDFVAWRDNGGEVISALGSLANLSDQDFAVGEDDRIFYWRRQFGADLSASVQLVQGYHIADWRPSWSLDPVVTEVVLSSSNRNRFATAPSVAGHDADAYGAFGPRQMRGTYRGRLPRAVVQSAAIKQAERLSRLGQLITFDVVDVDGCFGWFRRGDTITVVIADIDRALKVRCLALSWSQDANILRVSGEITA